MNIVSLPHPNKLLVIESLDYPNAYDFHAPHRHDYFEIILINKGSGDQRIDFTSHDLNHGDIYIVYPGQVHLLNRNTANGLIIQFRKDIFEFLHPLRHQDLHFIDPHFVISIDEFEHLYHLTEQINSLLKEPELSRLSLHKTYSYLQIILISLIELKGTHHVPQEKEISSHFLSLISQHIKTKRKVSDYAELLFCSSDKLTNACKSAFGQTPLKLIHQELMLEIRRLILLNKLTLKEIAYELNFDSQANFSAFIRTSTNKTPTELQHEILKLYNE